MSPDYHKAETFQLSGSGWGEVFVQDVVAKDPAILTLGDLVVRDKERRQSRAGRLDFLLQDLGGSSRYEVEIQLGPTDESHIIRTIEYWDIERKKFPDHEHTAVIVAEEITSRFFNVISLFNQSLPLIAIKMTGLRLGDKSTLLFTKVLDYLPRGDDEEGEYQETNRAYWEERTSTATMNSVDQLFSIAAEIIPSAELQFKKVAVPIKITGQRHRIVTLYPQKRGLKLSLHMPRDTKIEDQLASAHISFGDYNDRRKKYLIHLLPADISAQKKLLKELISRVYEEFKASDPALMDGDE